MATEAMGVEKLVEARWRLEGFWVDTRVPLKTPKGGWSDIDVLGWHAVTKTLRLGSCKAYGRSNAMATWPVPAGTVTDAAAKSFLKSQRESWAKMLRFFADPNYVSAGASQWLPPLAEVEALELHFVGAIWIAASTGDGSADPDGDHEDAAKRLNEAMTRLAAAEVAKVPRLATELARGLTVEASASGYVTLIAECIREMAANRGWGPRTGVPMLDVIRELVRATGGSARWSYAGNRATRKMQELAVEQLLDAMKHR